MPELAPAAQFSTFDQQRDTAHLGMWVFLATEVLFFGGLLMLYFAYRMGYPTAFAQAGSHTEIVIGTTNTAVLLTSSFAVAWAVEVVKGNEGKKLAAVLLGIAAVLGLMFIALKGLEYSKEYDEHLVPAFNFEFPGPHAAAAQLFYVFYFIITGLHGLHVTIGVIALSIMARRCVKRPMTEHLRNAVTVTGLYWHFVDIIWIFLFALIYLPGRNGS
jgi:cytochrome c oxidase subunit 3